MTLFTIYIFGLAPAFLVLFVQLIRSENDISIGLFLALVFSSVLPFYRELMAVFLFSQFGNTEKFSAFFNRVAIKKIKQIERFDPYAR